MPKRFLSLFYVLAHVYLCSTLNYHFASLVEVVLIGDIKQMLER